MVPGVPPYCCSSKTKPLTPVPTPHEGPHLCTPQAANRRRALARLGMTPPTFLGCSGASYLPQRPLFSEHGHQHARGDHQAGEEPHEDAQSLGPGGEAVGAVLGGLVLDDVVHQQRLRGGGKVSTEPSGGLKPTETSQREQDGSQARWRPAGGAGGAMWHKGGSPRGAGTTQHHEP